MAVITTDRGARPLLAAGNHAAAGAPRRDGAEASATAIDTRIRSRLFDFGDFEPAGDLAIRRGHFGSLKFGGTATFGRRDERGLAVTIHARALKGLIRVEVLFAYDLLPDGKVAYRGKRQDDGPRNGDEPASGDAILEVVEQRPGRTVLQAASGKQAILSHDPARGVFTLTYDSFTVEVETGPDSGM